jgi:regulator of sigma E protease
MTILSFLACIGPLIFVHELGHYFVGRWCGVKADVFSIGFGKEVAGWTDRRGTRWKVGWLPLGGYVKFKGDMNPASQPSDEWLALPAEERAQTFQSKPLWQRALIVAAGPVINFLLAILLFMGIFAAIGYPTAPPLVTGVVAGGPAALAGVAPGDLMVSLNGREVSNFAQVKDYVMLRPAQSVELVIERDVGRLTVPTTTGVTTVKDRFGNEAKIGTLGVYSTAIALEKLPLSQLPGRAVAQTSDTVQAMVLTLGQLITGKRSVKELGGPLKIAQVSGQQASLGWLPFFWLMAVISINLGFINLLPIPLLDGGHLLFYGIEAVRRKPLKPEAQEWAFRTGLAALLALMVFVTFNDLSSFGVWKHLGG